MKKSIFLFFAAILCATNAWGAKLFFDHSSVNYPADGALVAIWSWGGSSSDAWSVFKASGATNKIVADIADGRTGGKIVRFQSSVTKPDWNAAKWNETGDISFPSGKNCIKITNWDNATTGTWSTFQLESQASITPSASSVSVGEEVTFTPALTSNQEYNDVLSTTYSVGAGATITDGKFVATEAGTYTVTATVTYNAQGYTNITKTATATCSITVSEVAVPHPVTGVTIAPTSVTIKQGATATLTATVSPSNADNPSITWSSDNASVATVVNGVVTAVAAGTANITVTTVDGGFTATCAVKVKPSQYTFYAINSAQWPTVAAHYWGGADGGSSWPGADMVKESETINGFDIYSITISSDFINIMFTNQLNGDDNKKTDDLTTEGNNGKYYDIKGAKWYASLAEVPAPAETETVYFVNADDWTGTIYAYAFADGGNTKNAGWPGEVAQKEANQIGGHDVYSYTAEKGKYETVIFNNNSSNQTSDMTWAANQYICQNEWCADEDAVLAKLNGPIEYEIVYFVNADDWTGTIYAYAFADGGNTKNAGWPGEVAQKEANQIGGHDVYSYTAEKGKYETVIFNNNSSNQTSDMTWAANQYICQNEWCADEDAVLAKLNGPVEDVYTVVGSSALCGSEWNPSDASNDMTLVDGLYVWTKENVTLTGNTTFKIVKNHDYGQGEWPSGYGQNATIDISTSDCTEGGTYSIKITFDPTTGTITPTIESCEAAEEPIVHTYTVVGQAVLCESDWNISDATNDMTLTDGIYVWTNENVELRSNAEFRIVKDHAYDEAYPDGNYVIDLASYEGAAVYTVTITFNADTKEITVDMEKTGDVTPVVYTYYLMGVNGDWTTGIEMEVNTDAENEVMLTCQPVNGEVKIKRLGDDESEYWYGGNSLKAEEGNLGTNTSTDGGDGNILLEEGIYNFYFNTADGKLWIAAATDCQTVTEITLTEGDNSSALATTGIVTVNVEREFEKANLYTIALPFTINNAASVFGNGTVVYNFANLAYDKTNEEYILGFTKVSKIEAGKPYLIEPGQNVNGFVAENVILSSATSVSKTVKVDNVEKTATMTAVLSKTTTGGSYWLAENRYLYNDNVDMPALRALFVLPTTPSGMPARARVALKEDAATGVEDLFTTDAPVKVIVNGQLIIIRDGVKYNVQGQKL